MWGYPKDYPKGLLGRGEVLNIAGTDQLVLTNMEQGHYFISFSPLNANGYRCS